jgi:prepilin-type N-terminal cleavage/methylation domain-containing protein
MKIKNKQSGLTLVELLVVLGIIAAVIAISLPAINTMQKSFDSTGAEGMISAALSTARTLAISKRQYVGVRFQTSYDVNNVLDENQYMIFIVFDEEKTNWKCGFMAVEGYKPMKLPDNIGVIDKTIKKYAERQVVKDCGGSYTENPLTSFIAQYDPDIVDTMTFSIVFSPAGKLVIHEVRCRNNENLANDSSKDTVFNTQNNVEADPPTGMFVEDYLTDGLGLGVEKSRKIFYIYDRAKLRQITNQADRWDYISSIVASCVNPYTGGIIDKN